MTWNLFFIGENPVTHPIHPLTEPTPVESLSYEQALAELEIIVADLESEKHSLDYALALFERGQALAQRCTSLLDQAELKVQQVTGDQLTPFQA
jgi:exodeoxyribonuclease VII small subunit